MEKFLEGKLKYLTLFIAGGLADLALAPFYVFPVLFLSFPVFFTILNNADNKKQAFKIGWMFGFGFFLFGLYWIANSLLVDAEKFAWLIPFAVCGIPFGLAIYTGLFGLAYNTITTSSSGARCAARGSCKEDTIKRSPSFAKGKLEDDGLWQKILVFAALWVIFEYLRGILFTGFPWNLIGYAGLFSRWFAQGAAIGGVYLLSLLVVLITLAPVYYKSSKFLSLVIVITIANYAFGYHNISQKLPSTKTVKFLVFQPNVKQTLKWDPNAAKREFIDSIDYLKTTDFKNKDVVLWPESGVPYYLSREPWIVDALKIITPENGLLITGALRSEGDSLADYKVWNTLYAISQKGIYSYYDKIHLVPFGEFVPFRKYLPLDKITPGAVDFSSGGKDEIIKFNDFSFLSLICYEVIFPEYAASKQRPDFLLNVTNDGWFGNSSGPYQHLAAAQMRAIEQGLPLIRDANSGISAVIDANGQLLKTLPLDRRGILEYDLDLRQIKTIYSIYGDKVIFGLIVIIMIVLSLHKRKTR